MGPPFSLLKPAERHVCHRLWPLCPSAFASPSPSPSGEGGVQKEQLGRGVCVIVFLGETHAGAWSWGWGQGVLSSPAAMGVIATGSDLKRDCCLRTWVPSVFIN